MVLLCYFFYLGTCITRYRDEPKRYEKECRTGQQCILPAASNEAKIKIYKTLIRSVIWYGSKLWRRLQTAEEVLNESERKVLRRIQGCMLINGHWRNIYNQEIYKLYKEMELTRNIRLRRLQWVGQVTRMKEERVPKKALKGHTDGR
jgi:hypothetical protein